MSRTTLLQARDIVSPIVGVHKDRLVNLAPGDEVEHVFTPQKNVTLRRVLIRDVTLLRVHIGKVEVPFAFCGEDGRDGRRLSYRATGLLALRDQLVATGAAIDGHDEIALPAGLNVRLLLRNDQERTATPRASLLVEEK
jgi:hypothetical protein